MRRFFLLCGVLLLPTLALGKPEKARGKRPNRPNVTVPPADADAAPHGKRGITQGDLLLSQGRWRQAAQVFAAEVQQHPDLSTSWIGWGKAQAKLGLCASALEKFWPFTHTRPFTTEVALLAGRCSSRLGFDDDAVYFDILAVERSPANVQARSALALDLDRTDDVVGRDEVLEQLALLDPDRDASLFATAAVALRRGDLDTFDEIDAIWQREGRSDEEFLRLRAQSWLDLDDPIQAYAELTAVRRFKRGQGARLLLAESLRRSSQPQSALSGMDKKSVMKMQGMEFDLIRSRVLVDLGRAAEARALVEEWALVADEEVYASQWYLAHDAGDSQAMETAARAWALVQSSPLRRLEQLLPVEKR